MSGAQLPPGAMETLTAIAAEHLRIDTLELRGRDALDFHDLGVASLTRALAAAFAAGAAFAFERPAAGEICAECNGQGFTL